MASIITLHNHDPIGLEEVARAVRLHPEYAAALLRKAFGSLRPAFLL